MHGNSAIFHLNNARVHDTLQGLKATAEQAKQQNHPSAEEHQTRYEKLAKELGV